MKRYGTLDAASGGRLVLGVGVGSLGGGFALLGRDCAGRGGRAREALRAIRACFARRAPEWHGEHFDFAAVIVEPASGGVNPGR